MLTAREPKVREESRVAPERTGSLEQESAGAREAGWAP